ncbi:MAG: hypothetical protein RMK93_03005 [Bacteroidota bacterium]|nr:hypothetical protein [Bacteroidota bacterium]
MRFQRSLAVAAGICLLGTVILQGPHVHSLTDEQFPGVQQSCWLCLLSPLVLPDLPETGRPLSRDVAVVERTWEPSQVPHYVFIVPLCCRAPPQC